MSQESKKPIEEVVEDLKQEINEYVSDQIVGRAATGTSQILAQVELMIVEQFALRGYMVKVINLRYETNSIIAWDGVDVIGIYS